MRTVEPQISESDKRFYIMESSNSETKFYRAKGRVSDGEQKEDCEF